MAVRAGAMRHRIKIQVRTTVQDETGDPLNNWSDVAERWASVEPLVGREFFASQQRNGRVQTRFRLRYVAGIAPRMRIEFDGRVFDITEVQAPRSIKNEMILMADELVERSP